MDGTEHYASRANPIPAILCYLLIYMFMFPHKLILRLTVAPMGRMLPRNPSVERTFSLPANPTTSGSFLLPSYPLATLPGGVLTSTLSHHQADPSLSMSNTWPNKKENSPHQRDTSPWSDTSSKGNVAKRHSLRCC